MLARVCAVMLNTYREAVRAKVLHGLFALALVTAGYCVVVGQFATGQALRTLSDLGSATVALYGAFVSIVLSATALHREIELKTLFPILARPIARWEYVLGKYLGTVLTLAVFVTGNTAVFLLALAGTGLGRPVWPPLTGLAVCVALPALFAWRIPALRTFAPAISAALLVGVGAALAAHAPDDRRMLMVSALLTVCEVGVVAAIALLFSAFSSPFLTAIFTLGVFIVGRSADTLAKLPARMFGELIHDLAAGLARIVPNLMLYVPERALLTGEATQSVAGYAAWAALHAAGWAALLLCAASLVFRRRDLT